MNVAGTAAVAGEVVQAAASALSADRTAAEGEQLGMFDLPTAFEGAAKAAVEARAARARGPGRPAGAANKSTAELRAWLLAKGGHPLVEMVRWAMHSPETLSIELGCTKLEAFDRLIKLRGELAPYFIPRLQPTDEAGRVVPPVMIVVGGAEGGVAPGLPPWAYLEGKRAEIGHSGAVEDPQSHARQSHEDGK